MRSARRHSATHSILARLKKATQQVSVELLETRRLMAAVVVNTAVDQIDAPGSPTVSLRDAIAIANNSVTSTDISFDPNVFAAPQTIALQGNSPLTLTSGQDVNITGSAAGVTIDAGNNSGVLVDQASGGNVNISNMTLTNGTAYYGGGIYHTGADNLTITNVTVTNCTAAYDGGGIFNTTTMVIAGSTITANDNINNGGAAGAGGGIDNTGTLTVTDSTISGNTDVIAGSIGGGGISSRTGGTLTLMSCTVSGNTDYSNAGGTPANSPGGGVLSTGTLTVTNSTITGNTGSLGGGIYATGTSTISDSTISGNTGMTGGGMYAGAAVTIQNTVVSGNTNLGGGSSPDVASQMGSSVLSSGFNFIGASDGSSGWVGTDILGSVASPLNAQLGALANNGGPTETMLPQVGSPLVDAGSNALVPNGVSTDQRGVARISNVTVDIGAVETQATVSVTAPAAQTALVGISKSFNLGSFTQVSAVSPFSVVVNWGDGSANTNFSANAAGTIAAKSHTFPAAGPITVTVTVTDASGNVSGSASFTVTVSAGTVTVTPAANQTAFVGISKSFTLGSFTQLAAAAPFSVRVNWGDGTANTTFSQNAAGTIAAKSHTFGTVATETVTVTVTDASGSVTNSGTFNVVVSLGSIVVTAPANQTAVLNVSKSFAMGSFTATNAAGPFSVDVNWGDGSTDTTFTANAAGNIAAQAHTFAASTTSTVTITVSDVTGLVTNAGTFSVVVAAPSITVTAPAAQTAFVGTSQSVSLGSFTQINATGPFNVTVDWGDSSTPTTFTTNSAGTIPAKPHIYAAVGSDTVTVTVTDASGTVTSSATFGVTVTSGTTPNTTTLQASSVSILFGQAVTLTATVIPSSATGTVTFDANGISLGTSNIAVGGVATLTTTALASGTDSITASYGGSPIYAPSSSLSVVITVVPPPNATTTSVAFSSSTINSDQSVTMVASVVAPTSASIATGTVTFYQAGGVLGRAELQTDGVASFTTTSGLPVGMDSIVAVYGGASNFTVSTSPPAILDVLLSPTNTVAVTSTPGKTAAQSVTLAAAIHPTPGVTANILASVIPTGSVTFSDNGIVIGTAAVDFTGTAELTTTTLGTGKVFPLGTNLITASYTGDSAFTSSVSTAADLFVTEHALVPQVTKVVVPAAAIGGEPVQSAISASLNNQLQNLTGGTEAGLFSVTIFASRTTALDTTGEAVVASITHRATIRAGRTIRVSVPISSLPASLATGRYHLLLATTDASGDTETIDTGSMVNVTAPVISLSAAFVSVPPTVLKNGAVVSVTTSGNTYDHSKFTAVVGFATDAAGHNIVASGTGKVLPAKPFIRLGNAGKLRVSGWRGVAALLPPGFYYLTITLTDATGHTVFAVSPQQVSL